MTQIPEQRRNQVRTSPSTACTTPASGNSAFIARPGSIPKCSATAPGDERVELHGRLEIAPFEQRGLTQPRPVRQHAPALHVAADQHRRARGTVIRPAGAIDRHRPPEFSRDQHHRIGPERPEPRPQGPYHPVEPAQLRAEPPALLGMRIPSAGLDHRDPRAVRGREQLRRQRTSRGGILAVIIRHAIGQHAGGHRLAPQGMKLGVALIEHGDALHQPLRSIRQRGRCVGRHLVAAAHRHRHRHRDSDRLCLSRRQDVEHPVEPAVLDLIGHRPARLEHILPVEMRPVAIG